MIIRLEMSFDTEDGYSAEEYPELSPQEIIQMMKEDFVDTVYKQYSQEELLDALEVVEEDCNEDDLEWVACDCETENCKQQICGGCDDVLARDCDN